MSFWKPEKVHVKKYADISLEEALSAAEHFKAIMDSNPRAKRATVKASYYTTMATAKSLGVPANDPLVKKADKAYEAAEQPGSWASSYHYQDAIFALSEAVAIQAAQNAINAAAQLASLAQTSK